MEKKGWLARWAEKTLNQQGLIMLYCGYRASPDPVPTFTFGKRRPFAIPPNVTPRNLTEAELNSCIASWTVWFGGWPVPLDAIPLAKSAAADDPIGGLGILMSRIIGIARHHAGNDGTTYILRIPAQSVIPVPPWNLSAAEQGYVILHQVPPETVIGEVNPQAAPALTSVPPFAEIGIPGTLSGSYGPDNPARFYREAVKQVCLRYHSLVSTEAQSDSNFLHYLEQRYLEEKQHIDRLIREGMPVQQIPLARLGLLILSAGLFTYGRLEAAMDILDSVPPVALQVGRLAWCLNGMLPLPATLGDAQRNAASIKTWLRSHQANLRWSEQQGKFVLA